MPAGFKLNLDELRAFLKRRAPGQSDLTTARCEPDEPEIVAGLAGGLTCGAPLAVLIRNTDARSADYREICDIPRPSHADYAAQIKFGGYQDVAGGGHFSGRLTAPLCAAGGICLQILHSLGIDIGAHILQMGAIQDDAFDPVNVAVEDFKKILTHPLPVLRREAGEQMRRLLLELREKGDSLGGIIECAAIGLPAGLGDPMFDGIENRLAGAVFGIPAIKGIEFGSGFAGAVTTGAQNNDSFYMDKSAGKCTVKTRTNHSGGILGGITSGMPVLFRAACKPTPSIAIKQASISFSRREDAVLQIKGRHDPCLALRATPCVEAAAAIALYDAYLDQQGHI